MDDDMRPLRVNTLLAGAGGGLLPHRRSGVPLTSPYNPLGRRPDADDFNSDSDSNAGAAAGASVPLAAAAGPGSTAKPGPHGLLRVSSAAGKR